MWMNNKRWMRHRVPRCSECGKRLSYIKDEYGSWHFACTSCGDDLQGCLCSQDYCFYEALFQERKNYEVKMDSRCKPCPFCGEQPHRYYDDYKRPSKREYTLHCPNHCIGTMFYDYTRLDTAIADWNHRVERKVIDGIYTCPWCGEIPKVDYKTGRVRCMNDNCVGKPFISYAMLRDDNFCYHEKDSAADWINLWNGVKHV